MVEKFRDTLEAQGSMILQGMASLFYWYDNKHEVNDNTSVVISRRFDQIS